MGLPHSGTLPTKSIFLNWIEIVLLKTEIMLGIWLSKKGKTKTLKIILIASLFLIGIGIALLM